MQWSWKWTQAKILLNTFDHYVKFEPGQIYRALSKNENSIGDYVKKRTSQGKLVEDNVTISIFEAFYQTLDSNQAMILDGFPRKPQQMYYFLEKEYRCNRNFLVVYFDVPRDVAVARLLERSKIEWREDDNLEAINVRIDAYLHETMPVIETLTKLWKIIKVNADDTIENIAADLLQKLKEYA